MKQNFFADLLAPLKKDSLLDEADFLFFKVPLKMTKDKIVSAIAKHVVDEPEVWLYHLVEYDLRILEALVQMGPGEKMLYDYHIFDTCLIDNHIIECEENTSDDSRKLWITKEMFDVVSPFLDRIIDEKEHNGFFYFERIITGIANVYGAMEDKEFSGVLFDSLSKVLGGEGLPMALHVIDTVPIIPYLTLDGKMTSILCQDPAPVIAARKKLGVKWNYRPYDYSYLNLAGVPFATLQEDGDEALRLKGQLKKYDFEDNKIDVILQFIWLDSQDVDMDDPLSSPLFECVFEVWDKLKTPAELVNFGNAVIAYANSLPKWVLKGRTALEDKRLLIPDMKTICDIDFPEEERLFTTLPKDIPPEWKLPSPTSTDGYPDLSDLNKLVGHKTGKGIPFSMAVKHVAPNDPCPCGSGLLYKYCHGKHLS